MNEDIVKTVLNWCHVKKTENRQLKNHFESPRISLLL
jgi:hypothetical protein